ncbi:unnamed protein product [Soboliphyme baturini]|uniref:OAR domain-containing protein n=1 Tax=Soboliphyme baturini TaxID=241478 RepID=A0A183IIX8_9BILA|nr:unnamed protein product [Soboliphyme baturini]
MEVSPDVITGDLDKSVNFSRNGAVDKFSMQHLQPYPCMASSSFVPTFPSEYYGGYPQLSTNSVPWSSAVRPGCGSLIGTLPFSDANLRSPNRHLLLSANSTYYSGSFN